MVDGSEAFWNIYVVGVKQLVSLLHYWEATPIRKIQYDTIWISCVFVACWYCYFLFAFLCTYIYNVYIYIHIYIRLLIIYSYIYTYTYMYTFVYIICVCLYICIYCVYICVYIYMCVCVFTRMFVCLSFETNFVIWRHMWALSKKHIVQYMMPLRTFAKRICMNVISAVFALTVFTK